MLPPFKLGVGGPVAGGDQYMPWIHLDDVVGIYLAALDGDAWNGPGQRHRPRARDQQGVLEGARPRAAPARVAPVPGLAIRLLYGEMAEIVTKGQRVVPRRAQEHGYAFEHPELEEALRDALGSARPC